MAEKPTYQELEQRIKELEEESVKRKLAEKSLKESEEKFRQMFETMNNGVAVYEAVDDGKDFIFKDFNAAGERIDDVKRETIIGKRVTTVFPGVEEFSLLDVFKRVWQTGKAENHPISFYKDDRLTGWRENFVYKLRSGEVVAIYEDITERKRAEKALRESEEKYRSMMESMKDEVYICSSDFRIQYMNPATVGRIGRDATGELCYSAIYGLDEECSWCISDEILQGKNVEYELLNPNNNRYYSISNSPIPHIDGSISKLAVCRDITDVKKMELQLQQANKMEAIGTLAGGIAHQFNNVLSVITGNIDLLEMDFPGDETVANYTRAMKDSARRMTQLTTQLLAYARGGKFHAKTVLFSDFVRETLPLLKHTWGSAIDVDTDLLLGIMNVKADLTQMQMVLSAVLTNASEAMEGKGRIRVTCIDKIITDETVGDFPGLTPGNYVNLTIVDDGKGMDKETRALIFEPFFTTKFTGRGLGMAAAYGVIKNHDGWISVESEPGKGTEVQIYLPAVEVPVKKHAKPESKAKWIKGTGTILVIEDEEPVMKISRAILERLGYRVLEAGTGQEAIDVVKTFDGHIDLALLDILLPDMSGNDIYPRIMEARPDLKVIVFSGYSIDGPAREILNAGAENFIQKPFTIATLSEKLKETLGSRQ
jgi:PAS domain S-box-containing protein